VRPQVLLDIKNTHSVFGEVKDIIPDTVVSTTNPDACLEYKGRGYVAPTVYDPMCDISDNGAEEWRVWSELVLARVGLSWT